MATLAVLVQDLPAELYSEIYVLVFTTDPMSRKVNNGYKPPSLLQVDRASRKMFAETFYGCGNIFTFGHRDTVFKWTLALNQEHRLMIEKIRYKIRWDSEAQYRCFRMHFTDALGTQRSLLEQKSLTQGHRESEACCTNWVHLGIAGVTDEDLELTDTEEEVDMEDDDDADEEDDNVSEDNDTGKEDGTENDRPGEEGATEEEDMHSGNPHEPDGKNASKESEDKEGE